MKKDIFIQKHWDLNAQSRFQELMSKTDNSYYGVTIPSVRFLVSGSKKLLDVGCGVGVLTNELAIDDRDVTGIDFSKVSVNVASTHFSQPHFIHSDIQDIDPSEKFDAVTAIMFFHNVPKPFPIIEKIYSLLMEDGKLIMIVPNSVVWFEKRRLTAERCLDFKDEEAYFVPFKIRNHEAHPSKFIYFNRKRKTTWNYLVKRGFETYNT